MTRLPVVLLHGWGGSAASTWEASGVTAALTAAGREVLSLDLPGHGPGSHSHDPLDYADLASTIEHRLPAGTLDVVGFSLGAKVALELACRDTARFRRMVIAGLGANAFSPEPLGELVAAALDGVIAPDMPAETLGLIEYAVSSGNDARALAACLRRPANPTLTAERLGRIDSSLLLIAGDLDRIAQPLTSLAQVLGAVEISSLSGVGHLALPMDPRFVEHVTEFLEDKENRP